jgi:murein DD-endopeptidase MepM/ murein hydrolase activator NlpD
VRGEQSAKSQNAQTTIQQLDKTLGTEQNQAILQRLQLNPKNYSQADFDKVSKDLSDDQGKQLLGYLTQYKEAMTALSSSNEALSTNQTGYIKALADYNKQYGDKLTSLRARFVALLLNVRSQLTQIEQSVAESLIEIDRTAASALVKNQKNKLQNAYNKFLTKLGVATDDVFETIFDSFNSVLDIFGQIKNNRSDSKLANLKAVHRDQNNSAKYIQAETDQREANSQARRELLDTQRANPNNSFGPPAEDAVKTPYRVISSGKVTRNPEDVAKHHDGKAYHSENGAHGDENYRSDGGKKRIVKDFVLYGQKGSEVPIPASVDGIARVKSEPGGYGNYVETVDEQGNVLARVAHGTRALVKDGQRVRRGQPLLIQGNTGRSNGTHTHWEGEESTWDAYYRGLTTGNWGDAGDSSQSSGSTSSTSGNQSNNQEKRTSSVKKPKPSPNNNIFKRKYRAQPKSAQMPMHRSQPSTGDYDLDAATKRNNEVRSGNNKDGDKGSDKQKAKTVTATPRSDSSSPTSSRVSESPYTNVVSSWYTPGQGGAINGGNEDIRGKYIDSDSLVMATRTTSSPQGLPYGSIVEVKDPKSGKTVQVSVTDRGTLRPGRDIDLTPAAAKRLGVTPDGVTGLQMRVISVPTGKPKPNYDLGSGIGSYDKKGNYTGKSGTIVRTAGNATTPNKSEGDDGLTRSNSKLDLDAYGSADQAKVLAAHEKLSAQYLAELRIGLAKDSVIGYRQATATVTLNNETHDGLLSQGTGQQIRFRNKIQQNTFEMNRRGQRLTDETAAINRSRDRSQYSSIDSTSQQYGGIADQSTVDPAETEAQATVDRITTERVDRGRSLLNQISQIEAAGAGWAETRKGILSIIEKAKKDGDTFQSSILSAMVADTDKALGTPQARQKTINALSAQYKALPSAGVIAYDGIAGGIKPSLNAANDLSEQYLPRSFNDRLQTEARGIIDRFAGVKTQLVGELKKIDAVITVLNEEIQSKLKAAGYAPQQIDLKDPKKLALLRKVAPQETATLLAATANRKKIDSTSTNLDEEAQTAASRSVSNSNIRNDIAVDRADLDYYSKTQSGNLYTQQKIDATSFQLGKRELDLDLSDGVISAELYAQKLRALKLETDTLQNAMRPLRESTNGFFSDIFKGKDVLSGVGDALRNLAISILQQLQSMISQHLGQQLFKSLTSGLSDIANDKNSTSKFSLANLTKSGLGLLGLKDTRDGLNPEKPADLPKPSEVLKDSQKPNYFGMLGHVASDYLASTQEKNKGSSTFSGGNLGSSLLSFGISALTSIPGFADGAVVSSPTLALVGEGVHNEAIVPMPNGRSIPVDLKNQGQTGSGAVNSSVSVAIHNNGDARETSRGEAAAISQAIKGAVMDVLINERRQGGLLA